MVPCEQTLPVAVASVPFHLRVRPSIGNVLQYVSYTNNVAWLESVFENNIGLRIMLVIIWRVVNWLEPLQGRISISPQRSSSRRNMGEKYADIYVRTSLPPYVPGPSHLFEKWSRICSTPQINANNPGRMGSGADYTFFSSIHGFCGVLSPDCRFVNGWWF